MEAGRLTDRGPRGWLVLTAAQHGALGISYETEAGSKALIRDICEEQGWKRSAGRGWPAPKYSHPDRSGLPTWPDHGPAWPDIQSQPSTLASLPDSDPPGPPWVRSRAAAVSSQWELAAKWLIIFCSFSLKLFPIWKCFLNLAQERVGGTGNIFVLKTKK